MNLHEIRFALILAFALLVITGCQNAQERLVTITYREPMQFACYNPDFGDPNPVGCMGFASYYTITCINNNSSNPSDFTFDVSKIHFNAQGDRLPVVTKDIPASPPAPGWKNSRLTASSILVPKGQYVKPTQPYAFIIIISPSNQDDQGVYHNLKYDAIEGQPVLMLQEANLPPPYYSNNVGTGDFIKGQIDKTFVPTLPPPKCP